MDVKVFACRCTCGTIKICFRVHRFVIELNLESLHSFDEDYVLQLPKIALRRNKPLLEPLRAKRRWESLLWLKIESPWMLQMHNSRCKSNLLDLHRKVR